MIDVLLIILGLTLLFFGSEALVKGTVSLARHFNISRLIVSMVIIGFGTSMPEMIVSVSAALKGSPDISLGNVVGSNIFNILFIIGCGALITPLLMAPHIIRRDTLAMILASGLLCATAFYGMLNFAMGVIMLGGLAGYLYHAYRQSRRNNDSAPPEEDEIISALPAASLYSLGGLAVMVGGAYLTVENAISLARHFQVSEAVIGLTIVAAGTSLPELAATLAAARRRQSDLIIGNIIGSNIFNIMAILGVTALIAPIPISRQFLLFDIWVMLGATAAFAFFLLRGKPLGRTAGLVMIAAYILYTFVLYTRTIA